MAAATLSRTRLTRAARIEQTLAVAHDLFAARGYTTVTMDGVATAVGVTKPLLYHYFGNKERLYLACMEPAGEALLEAVVGAVEQTSTPAHALRAGIGAFFEFVDRDRGAWRVLFDETLPVEGGIARRVGEYRTRITDLVSSALIAQLSGTYRVQIDALATALLGAAEALARWWLRSEALSAQEAADLLVRVVEPGLLELVATVQVGAAPSAPPPAGVAARARKPTPGSARTKNGSTA